MNERTAGRERIRVVLVDDQTLLRQSFQRLLELEGGDIEVAGTAGDGVEALALVERLARAGREPHVVLMDVRMPRMDGVQATKLLHARLPNVRVMMLTTFDDEELIIEGLRAGAKGYLLKDASAEQLVEAVHSVYAGGSPLQPSVAAKLVARLARTTEPPTPGHTAAAQGTVPAHAAAHAAAGMPIDDLTEREREILRLIARGDNNREIGEALFITEGTVKNHVSNILSKLGLRDRTQAALWAREHGLG